MFFDHCPIKTTVVSVALYHHDLNQRERLTSIMLFQKVFHKAPEAPYIPQEIC